MIHLVTAKSTANQQHQLVWHFLKRLGMLLQVVWHFSFTLTWQPWSILSFKNFCGGICLYLAQLSVNVRDMSAKLCLLPLPRILDDTLAIRKRLCCLLRVCAEVVVSFLFWWFNKGILLLLSTNNHAACLWDTSTICSGTAVHFACVGCWEMCCW